MELYWAIVKLEEDGNADGIQVYSSAKRFGYKMDETYYVQLFNITNSNVKKNKSTSKRNDEIENQDIQRVDSLKKKKTNPNLSEPIMVILSRRIRNQLVKNKKRQLKEMRGVVMYNAKADGSKKRKNYSNSALIAPCVHKKVKEEIMRTRAKRRCSCPVFQLWEVLISSTSVPASNGRPVVAIKTEIDDLFSQFVYKGGQCTKRTRGKLENGKGCVQEEEKRWKMSEQEKNEDSVAKTECTIINRKKAKTTVEMKQGFSAAQKLDEAYQRRSADNNWKAPCSHFNLLQEDHVHDPWWSWYAADAYAIFCMGKWEHVSKVDHPSWKYFLVTNSSVANALEMRERSVCD
ncbi:hypothetical protein LguiA_007021 [Lonicera macranthoides]